MSRKFPEKSQNSRCGGFVPMRRKWATEFDDETLETTLMQTLRFSPKNRQTTAAEMASSYTITSRQKRTKTPCLKPFSVTFAIFCSFWGWVGELQWADEGDSQLHMGLSTQTGCHNNGKITHTKFSNRHSVYVWSCWLNTSCTCHVHVHCISQVVNIKKFSLNRETLHTVHVYHGKHCISVEYPLTIYMILVHRYM